jgi:hypothetical protein
MRKKQQIHCGLLCSFPCARARAEMSLFSFVFFFYRSCRFFLCLGKEPRKQHRTRKSKRWKTFFIIFLFFSVLIIKLFFPRDAEAVLLTLLKNNQMKQRKRRKERIHSIATTVILHLNKIVYSYF